MKMSTFIRVAYLVVLLYTGYVFPVLIVANKYRFFPLELFLDVFQLFYIFSKRNSLQSFRQSLKHYFTSFSCLELIALIPFELW